MVLADPEYLEGLCLPSRRLIQWVQMRLEGLSDLYCPLLPQLQEYLEDPVLLKDRLVPAFLVLRLFLEDQWVLGNLRALVVR